MPKTKKNLDTLELSLDFPETDGVEHPEAGMDTLLSDQIPNMAAKLSIYEELLSVLTRDISFNEFMTEILLSIMKGIRCEAGSILEVNHEEKTLFFRAATGHSSDQITQFVIPMGKGIAGHVAEAKQPFVTSNLEQNDVHLKSISKSVGFDAKSLLAVPILVRGKIFGVLELLNRVGEKEFSASDVELAMQVCGYVSKAIEVRLMLSWSLQSKAKQSKGSKAA